MSGFYQYFKESFKFDRPLAPDALINKGDQVMVQAKHDSGPIKIITTAKDNITANQLIDQLRTQDPSIVTAVVYVIDNNQVGDPDINITKDERPMQPKKKKYRPMKRRVNEQDEQVQQNPQDVAKQQRRTNIDQQIAQQQTQMATIRQNADRIQQQLQAKQKIIDNLQRQKAAI